MATTVQQAALVGLSAFLGYKLLDEEFNISSDIEMARRLLALKNDINERYKTGYNVVKFWYDALKRNPTKLALIMQEDDGRVRNFTFNDIEKHSNKMAHFLESQGLKRGDTCALMMENRPEFVISWLGMAKIGVKVAMINTSIKEKGLVHCLKISQSKMVVFGAELAEPMGAVKDQLGMMLFSREGQTSFCPCADELIAKQPDTPPNPNIVADITMSDPFGYIYTSGTTGLPKAAVILHAKTFAFGGLMGCSFVIKEDDVVLTVLPLFHSAGGGLGIGMMLYKGCTVVLRKKFSASSFFQDCVKHKVTVVQYIGELCRYLVASPPTQYDRAHKVRIAIGNGLRPDIWDTFQTRFNIPEIGEFYGATEGNAALVNHCRTKEAQGACGRQGAIMKKISGIRFARFNVEEEKVVRGPDGLCINCEPGEPGELLFPIVETDKSTTFAGYEDPKATEKKIIRDAFVKGDKYFLTGDLLSYDRKGYIRFVDRIGDTFRSRGENCSTTEVAEVCSVFPGVAEANVVGVVVPNNEDGRMPLAAITPVGGDLSKIDLPKFAAHLKKNLPSYSVPMFLRIMPEIEVTATMKHSKVQVRSEGIDIFKIKEHMFYLDPKANTYVPLTKEVYAKITTPGARL